MINLITNTVVSENGLPIQFKNCNDKYLVTQERNSIIAFPFDCVKGLVVTLNDKHLMTALNYSLLYRAHNTLSGI